MRHLIVCLSLLSFPALAQDFAFPEAGSGFTEQKGGTAENFMVAAANPIAVQAGYDIIKAGGSAMDAALTVQLVLNSVEPQSSGIGGGAFIVYWDAKEQKLYAYDGRETAPASATEDRFLDADGKVLSRTEAVVGGLSVGVPGLVKVMEMAHQAHGTLDWAEVFAPAIKVAEEGFEVSPRLNTLLTQDRSLKTVEPAASLYYPNGEPLAVGTLLKNPAFAHTLTRIANEGSSAFYEGEIAEAIVAAVNTQTDANGGMTLEDIAGYQAIERQPLCGPYRSWSLCGMPAPTSGGIGVLQTMGILERFDLASMGPTWNAETTHMFIESARLVFADRAKFIADPDVVKVPQAGLVAKDYLAGRSQLMSLGSVMEGVKPGMPEMEHTWLYDIGHSPERISTTHFSVIDAEGNAVSMTSTIEGAFGSRLMAGGFLLNNQLTDFSYRAAADGRQVANRVQGGKRPRSSMSPTIVFDDTGALHAITGSPGGQFIVSFTVKTLIGMLDWGLTPQQAVNLPNIFVFTPDGDRTTVALEDLDGLAAYKEDMEALGHKNVRIGGFPSGVHALQIRDGVIYGGADPRREGSVLGD